MYMELNVADKAGSKTFKTHLLLDFGRKEWHVPELHSMRAGFSNSGIFELKPGGAMWLTDLNTARFNNRIVLHNAPENEADMNHAAGQGQIQEAMSPNFSGARVN